MNPTYIQLANGSTQCTVFFEENAIRVIEHGSDLHFCLSDVCAACGLANPTHAANAIKTEFGCPTLSVGHLTDALGRAQDNTMITEPQLYFVMMRGRSDAAHRFRQWVFTDLLPTLRKTGRYEVRTPAPALTDATLPQVPTCDQNGNFPVSYIQVMGELGDHYGMTQQGRDLLAWCIDRAKAQGYAIAKHQCGGTQVNWGLSEEDVRKRVEASTTCLKAQLAKAQEYIEELEAAPENKKAQADTQELRTKLELACGLVKSILENPNSKAIAGLAQTLVSELDKAV